MGGKAYLNLRVTWVFVSALSLISGVTSALLKLQFSNFLKSGDVNTKASPHSMGILILGLSSFFLTLSTLLVHYNP